MTKKHEHETRVSAVEVKLLYITEEQKKTNCKIDRLTELVSSQQENSKRLNDHEIRLRSTEQWQWKMAGALVLICFSIPIIVNYASK